MEPDRIPIIAPPATAPVVEAVSPRVSSPTSSECATAYETLLKCRELELTLHAERSNICLAVEGALMAFVAPSLLGLAAGTAFMDKAIPLLVAGFGIAISAISVSVVRGANFWIGYWEYRLAELESRMLPGIAIFRDHPSARNEALLARLPSHLKYVSSRNSVLRLFELFTLVWVALAGIVVLR